MHQQSCMVILGLNNELLKDVLEQEESNNDCMEDLDDITNIEANDTNQDDEYPELKKGTLLNSLQSPIFRVTQRYVHDRYALLEKKYKKKVKEETLASGISCEENEVDIGMNEIVSLFYEAGIEHERVAAEKKNLRKKPSKHLK
ncbi:Hypothetical predicted protein [Paramuricea clavata]|uniref:Uncharacterized protein n=1 Tax=Paramuricea clavata TaxID=317549 RepID=A0A7D9LHH8_PARCT|nr:Hypothetical predicted protein [Paramuricea clavata]